MYCLLVLKREKKKKSVSSVAFWFGLWLLCTPSNFEIVSLNKNIPIFIFIFEFENLLTGECCLWYYRV